MKQEKNIEIHFGASDSELHECEYTIPEGYEAEIKDGKVIVRKAETDLWVAIAVQASTNFIGCYLAMWFCEYVFKRKNVSV